MEFQELFGRVLSESGLRQIGSLAALGVGAALLYLLARRVLVATIRRAAMNSASSWDDRLVEASLFARLAYFAPALVVWYGAQAISLNDTLDLLLRRLAVSVLIVVAAMSISAFLTAVNAIYSADTENRRRPIKGYLQVVKILVTLISGVLIVATLMDKSPLIFLSGIGAMAAVLLLVFRDTLLSLVASVQLTGNDMVDVGDWIEMPQFGADGDVIDIALHTVKVQNWDKTITTIPTHKLIEYSFKNWRGMSVSGGRRIKRCLLIDVNTIRFLEEDEIERMGRFSLLHDYISRKTEDIRTHNADPNRGPETNADIRRLTNVGTLRAYIESYLQNHPSIHQGMTLMVRQLAPDPNGLPLEIYCFTNTTDWGIYEGIQSDLMDHIFSILPEFDIKAYQSPAGRDIALLEPKGGGSGVLP